MTIWTRERGFAVLTTMDSTKFRNLASSAFSWGPKYQYLIAREVKVSKRTWRTGYGSELDVYSCFGHEFVSSRDFNGTCYRDKDFGRT
jgi:hypothetical protein